MTQPNASSGEIRVLIVEDEGVIALDLQDRLQRIGYRVVGIAITAEAACRQAVATRPDVVLMDIVLRGERDGVDAARQIRRELGLPVIFLTSHADPHTLGRATDVAPFGYVLKPFQEAEVHAALQTALKRHRAEAAVRSMEAWLSTTLQSIGDGVIATDAAGDVVFLNAAAVELTGWSTLEAAGAPFNLVFRPVDLATSKPLPCPVAAALRDGRRQTIPPGTGLVRKDGSIVAVDDSAAPIVGRDGTHNGAVVVFRDCSERREQEERIARLNAELELRVEQRTQELKEANRVLKEFLESVTHDLRQPLHATIGFLDALLEEDASQLDEAGREKLDQVVHGARRMNAMIGDYQRLARLGRVDLQYSPVNMKALAEEVVEEFVASRTARPELVSVGDLPATTGDEALLRQVWVNLIGNALKFTRNVAEPRVEIGFTAEESGPVYWIRDNGAGFDPKNTDQLFVIFRRLHSEKHFEGTGVGLATVARIIQRHGGRIWAEGAVDEGAQFFFVLPTASNPSI